MLSFLAAAAAAVQTPPVLQEDPDLRCVVAVAVVSAMAESSASEEENAGLISIFMYFLGKTDARFPDINYSTEIKRIIGSPDYLEKRFGPDVQRCSQEAIARGEALEELGEDLQNLVPLADTQPG